MVSRAGCRFGVSDRFCARSRPGSRCGGRVVSGRGGRPVVLTGTDGTEHVVSMAALEAGARSAGRYVAVCGQTVDAAPLVAPPGRRCVPCRVVLGELGTRSAVSARGRGRAVRPGLLDRLLRRSRTTPVVAPPLPPALHPPRGDRSRTTAGLGSNRPTLVPSWPVREVARR